MAPEVGNEQSLQGLQTVSWPKLWSCGKNWIFRPKTEISGPKIHMWVPKLLLTPVKIRNFGTKTSKFCQNMHFGSFWAKYWHFLPIWPHAWRLEVYQPVEFFLWFFRIKRLRGYQGYRGYRGYDSHQGVFPSSNLRLHGYGVTSLWNFFSSIFKN